MKWEQPPDGKAILEHVVTVFLKQPKDGPLAKALDREGFCEIFDLLSPSQSDCDDLRYVQADGSEAQLSIGHKGMLKTLKLFTAYNIAEGHPINDWTQVTKKDFMTSGLVMHACLLQKRTTTLCYLLHQ